MPFHNGARVQVTDYGVVKAGTVERDNGHGIVFVRMDDTQNIRWYHPESLTLISPVKPALYRAYRFFFEHAGYVVGQRAKGALAMARAEEEAKERGIVFVWEGEECPDYSWLDKEQAAQDHEVECARAVLPCPEHGVDCRHARTLAGCGNIFDADSDYRRVMNAELAIEALAELNAHV